MVTPAVEVVNFESVNKVPVIKNLKECRKSIMDGMTNVWYEYVPESYDGDKEVPLVVQVHGGGHDGKRWANLTIWHELAEKEGFIVIYPNSTEYGCWPCEEADIKYLYDLIQHICSKYKIDKKKIFMQGMSNGDMMTLAFSMKHPEVLAAAGYMSGPSAEEILDGDRPSGALPIIQMRGELDINWRLTPEVEDVYEMRYSMNDLNREIWEKVNGCEEKVPALAINGKDNYLYYFGENAPIIEWEIQGMGHREPVYSAQVVWDRIYSGYERDGVKIVKKETKTPMKGDDDIVVVAAGSNKAYKSGEIIQYNQLSTGVAKILLPAKAPHFCPIKLDEMCETEVMSVPVEFFSEIYGAKVSISNAGDKVEVIFQDGKSVKLEADSMLVNMDGTYMAMQKPCIFRCGIFYVPLAEFCQMIMGKQVSFADDVMCITDHYAVLGRYTARVIRKLLGGIMRKREKAIWNE